MLSSKWLMLFLISFTVSASAMSAFQAEKDPGEGFDRQSPVEIEKARLKIEAAFGEPVGALNVDDPTRSAILKKYQYLDPGKEVPSDLLEDTVVYYDQNLDKFPNKSYITIVDFSKRSDLQRLFVVDMTTGAVEKYHTTHGWASDKNNDGIPDHFGNVVNSGKSSLGFIRTAEVYMGKFKRSVRLDGLSKTDSRIRERAIVLHGWDKAHEAPVIQGMSWGCIAMDWSVIDAVVDKVKEGSLMYVGSSKIK